jgi:metal-responsive CopG/Arc/MetJ family transcriptional regulator
MAKELLEDAILKPISISLNPKTLREFDEIVGQDQRSKTIRRLIRKHIDKAKLCIEDTSAFTEKD